MAKKWLDAEGNVAPKTIMVNGKPVSYPTEAQLEAAGYTQTEVDEEPIQTRVVNTIDADDYDNEAEYYGGDYVIYNNQLFVASDSIEGAFSGIDPTNTQYWNEATTDENVRELRSLIKTLTKQVATLSNNTSAS